MFDSSSMGQSSPFLLLNCHSSKMVRGGSQWDRTWRWIGMSLKNGLLIPSAEERNRFWHPGWLACRTQHGASGWVWTCPHTCRTGPTIERAWSVETLHKRWTRCRLEAALIYVQRTGRAVLRGRPPSMADAAVLGLAGWEEWEWRQPRKWVRKAFENLTKPPTAYPLMFISIRPIEWLLFLLTYD